MPLSAPILATPADTEQIAKIHLAATIDASKISKTAFGNVDRTKDQVNLEVMLTADINRPYKNYLDIKDTDTSDIISYVLWVEPHTKEQAEAEEAAFKASFKRPPPLEGTCGEIMAEFMEKITAMRRSILGDPPRPHWLCGNLETDPRHQRRGAATALMQWPFAEADRSGLPIYLDTDLNGPAIAGYRRLGFVQVGEGIHIDLEKYRDHGVHTHVGMIREPKRGEV